MTSATELLTDPSCPADCLLTGNRNSLKYRNLSPNLLREGRKAPL
ncbi:hypothetical protein [Acetobacter pasteurianus]|uniref:Uncharacterized protein n=3 Tax=Acetobacter pasteurianus TaxID=438 RepID=A0A401WYW4_ACEPA|nr:hypothetical protein [Acetobacter pasteurianus]ARW49106.1 hypothetical protein S1001342_02816 [Acetobacter pasteurianus subsp. pasteurianus]GCD60555.1 hypothetical protein NBRC3277_3130 [Acetobacter pasteurianus NBRC 3277]GCD64115.1 hypothetical protein NBRC3278_3208 [Acetobacter pasteurianus NBRC 3278]GCD70535.1 hypothetical protein NBRC3280_3170 [Acetobacter pasteurianus NBRC 3280]GCD54521.1 hypothetical protein NBRC3188_3218 [Acetobacter pasteurianus NBRC 3188]